MTTHAPIVFRPGDVLAVDDRTAHLIAQQGLRFDVEAALAPFAASSRPTPRGRARKGGSPQVAVVAISGLITQEFDWPPFVSSTTRIRREVAQAAADQDVASIVLAISSPGGGVYGVRETYAVVRAAARRKPVMAVASALAASAAYWIASAATEIAVTPSGEIGSVGVYMAHAEQSRALDKAGVAVTLIAQPDASKTLGNPFEPLSEEARSELTKTAGRYYHMFSGDVAAGRGVPVGTVRSSWRALTYGPEDAARLGLADRVATLEQSVIRAAALPRLRAEGRREGLRQIGIARERLIALTSDPLERLKLRADFHQADVESLHPRLQAEREAAALRRRLLG